MHNTTEFDVGIIGTGLTGLACAYVLANRGLSVVLLERHRKFGQETSSRNSEVIHSGIYYPAGSAKTALCIAGRKALYDFCARHHVPCRKTGKFVVATTQQDEAYLEKLSSHARELGVSVEKRTGPQVKKVEPLVEARSALWFAESGIVDCHQLMERLLQLAESAGAVVAYGHKVVQAERAAGGAWTMSCELATERLMLTVDRVVNAGGLAAAELSNQALHTKSYEHRYCRGRYLTATGELSKAFKTLVYPVPPKDGLGVHVTVDMNGACRFGPDVDWWTEIERKGEPPAAIYDCDWDAVTTPFLAAIQRYAPSVKAKNLASGFIGVRPKLFIDDKAHPDFLIEQHEGWIHCLGIESPGLTASLAIADTVSKL